MKGYAATFVVALLVYLFLTAGSGDIGLFGVGLWSMEEIVVGIVLSAFVSAGTTRLFCGDSDMRMANPRRWLTFIVYLFPFFFAMARANFDVAYRVITGKIKPGIVRIKTGFKKDLSVLLLGNSITLTPGTLTVDIDDETNDLFVHWINIRPEAKERVYCDPKIVCGSFVKWARRISE